MMSTVHMCFLSDHTKKIIYMILSYDDGFIYHLMNKIHKYLLNMLMMRG